MLAISNHNSSRVLFDKTASVYFIAKIYQYFSIGNGQLQGTVVEVNELSSPVASYRAYLVLLSDIYRRR